MNCPHCGHDRTRATETRPRPDGDLRYRTCRGCGKTFTTMERVCVFAGKAAGYLEPVQRPALQLVEPETPQSAPPAAAKRTSTRRWHPSGVPEGVCEEAAPLLLEWWNESRRSKQGSHATWSEKAWLASVERVKKLSPAEQVALCAAGVEYGWQALKPEYINLPQKPVAGASGRPMPKDPAMLAVLDTWASTAS